MGWFDSVIDKAINTVGGGADRLLGAAEHAAGAVAHNGAQLLGDGLDAVWLHGAAQAVVGAGPGGAGGRTVCGGEPGDGGSAGDYAGQVSQHNQAAEAYDGGLAAGRDPGIRPVQPAPFTDPGESSRQDARAMLARARRQRDEAAGEAQAKIRAASNLAPAEPSVAQRMLADAEDLGSAGRLAGLDFTGGVVKGAGDLVKFGRSLDPADPYKVTHLPQYVAGVSGTVAGLVHDLEHPQDLAESLIGTGWGSDPAQALGRLAPNMALAAGTDGAGTAADATAAAGARVAADAGADAAGWAWT
ncbi:MAG TPA: hypothetical protein VLW50_25910 [Streptosporangiaceae bacterium]|nr:hypothetical protein [Streptosporangiaceae bacterium]